MTKKATPRRPDRSSASDSADAEVSEWRGRVRHAVAELGTPCLVFAAEPLARKCETLTRAFDGLSVRHWWSFKTLPLLPAVAWWRREGRGVEVVSEREFVAVLAAGVPAPDILVNGPAKHHWLPRHPVHGLRVNFDSLGELARLAPLARQWGWSTGLRLSARGDENFEYPGVRAQFGLLPSELGVALRRLKRERLEPGVLHFHLRTNVPEARCYREAAGEALDAAASVGWRPEVLDLGGGFPPARVRSRKGAALDAGFSLASMREVLVGIRARHRHLREFWLENGRWLTADCAVLAIRVLDLKEGRGARLAICDGGRTLQAMVATWEKHRVTTLRGSRGACIPTMLHGPTCMTFDNLGLHDLPKSLKVGDVLLWWDAGAYHLSWETRFSHGLGAVAWCDSGSMQVVRRHQNVTRAGWPAESPEAESGGSIP